MEYFHKDLENSKGTKDMVTRAINNRIETINGETGRRILLI